MAWHDIYCLISGDCWPQANINSTLDQNEDKTKKYFLLTDWGEGLVIDVGYKMSAKSEVRPGSIIYKASRGL